MPLHERHNALNQDVMMVPATPVVDQLQEVNDLNFDQQLETDIIPVPLNDEVDDKFEYFQLLNVDVGMHNDEGPTLIAYVIVKVILLVMLASAAIIVTYQIKL